VVYVLSYFYKREADHGNKQLQTAHSEIELFLVQGLSSHYHFLDCVGYYVQNCCDYDHQAIQSIVVVVIILCVLF
jgi:hypothetical protein